MNGLKQVLEQENKMSLEEVMSYFEEPKTVKEINRITIYFDNGFPSQSDTRDVFEGLYGCERMEDSPFIDAFDGFAGVLHTFFLKNPIQKGFEAFSERSLVKRLLADGYWTTIQLNDQPLINGCYVTIMNETISSPNENF